MKVREIIEELESQGWYQVDQTGSHRQFKHPSRQGRVTVAGRESADLTLTTLRSIYRQAGLDWSRRKR
ncbi:MAG: type II toxin-antitoxin system HicA family toxin [Acidobacteria bacterium]|nr:type II toxin-antitoxin system HicA family toxin [Acidobacteriota bacterium]